MRMRHLVVVAFAAVIAIPLALLAPRPAVAHDFEPQRELLVQVFDEHVDIMVVYTEAPGERSNFFLAQFGFDVDGELGEALDILARRAILPRVLDGLEFEVAGEQPETGEPQVELRDEDGPLRAAAYVRYELESLDDGEPRTMIIRAEDRSFLPTETLVYPGGDLMLADDERSGESDAAASFTLLRDGEYSVNFVLP